MTAPIPAPNSCDIVHPKIREKIMRTLLTYLIIMLASVGAVSQQSASSANAAQSTSQALPPGAASREQVLKLFTMLNVRKTTEMTIQAALQQAKINAEQLFQQQTPNATPEQVKQFKEMMDGVMDDTFGSLRSEERRV